jgi:hypothetical protein
MLFFRSEERAREWCSSLGHPLRPLVRIDQLWVLAREWYGTRLEAESRRPQPAEMRQIFGRLGLADEFWNPQSDAFGAGTSGPARKG